MPDAFSPPLSAFDEAEFGVDDSAYLAVVRNWTQRLGRRTGDAGAADALADLHEVVELDVDVPITGVRRSVILTKRSVKALTGWYLRYLARQLIVQAQAVERLGTALVDQADRTERVTVELARDVAVLKAQVAEMTGELPR